MSKNILLLFISSFLIAGIFFSCEKEESDTVKPTLQIILPKSNDTLHLGSTYKFEAIFQDDKGLSSYFIQVSNPNIHVDHRLIPNPDSTRTDSLLYLNQIIQRANIFGIRDTAITVAHSFVLDSTARFEGRGPFEIIKGKYQFKVVVMDIAGNRDSASFEVDLAAPLVD